MLLATLLLASCTDVGSLAPERALPTTLRGAIASGTATSALTLNGVYSFSVGPTQTFLRAESDDSPSRPLVIDLSALGIRPGDQLRLEQLGSFTFTIYDQAWIDNKVENGTALFAVFSSSGTVYDPILVDRVPGAITIGGSALSPATLFLGLPTDIPQDFAVGDVTVTVPQGATHLIVGVPDSWYKDNADYNGDFGLRMTAITACQAPSAIALPASATAGTVGVNGRVFLPAPAGPGGVEITLDATTEWRLLELPAPKTASVPATVVVPEGASSVTFPITTFAVSYPLMATIRAKSCGITKSDKMTVMPTQIPPFGPAANERVFGILQQFLPLGSHEKMLGGIVDLRNSSSSSGIAQDIYLAAADHYLFARVWVEQHPEQLKLVAGLVPAYEIIKLAADIATTDRAASPATPLSVYWGEKGVVDAVIQQYGSDIVRGGRW